MQHMPGLVADLTSSLLTDSQSRDESFRIPSFCKTAAKTVFLLCVLYIAYIYRRVQLISFKQKIKQWTRSQLHPFVAFHRFLQLHYYRRLAATSCIAKSLNYFPSGSVVRKVCVSKSCGRCQERSRQTWADIQLVYKRVFMCSFTTMCMRGDESSMSYLQWIYIL